MFREIATVQCRCIRWTMLLRTPVIALGMLFVPGWVVAQTPVDIEAEPIVYSDTPAENRITRLIAKIQSGETVLEADGATGYLKSLLRELEVPSSTQTLVFSKTSMQVRYISRRNPRAIYFNDDTFVGWVRGAPVIELSTFDPKLGAAFYTLNARPGLSSSGFPQFSGSLADDSQSDGSPSDDSNAKLPLIRQAKYECLSCHATSMTQGVPGHVVRSVVPDFDGSIAAQRDSYVTDHTSPFSERWGGWYVTGKHGSMTHMGNAFMKGGRLDVSASGNRLSLRDEFATYDYLSPYSDIVALMVLEHQTQMHNSLTRANFLVRRQVAEHAESEPSDEAREEFGAQLQLYARDLIDGLLFRDETKLEEPIKGSFLFTHEFKRRGKPDKQGRSLREFDLQSRIFKYPCSYLIDSPAFENLHPLLKPVVLSRLQRVLTEGVDADRYPHLDQETKTAIAEILQDMGVLEEAAS